MAASQRMFLVWKEKTGMKRTKSNIGREWKAFRKRLLFTQTALAQALGISLRQVQYIEKGTCTPQYRTQGKFNALKSKHERREP